MHSQELAVCHALGLKERSANNVVIDMFEQGKNLRTRVKALLSKIMDKKAKNRYKEYVKICRTFLHALPNKLELPNETRVSGTFKMYLSALRSRDAIVLFLNNSKDKAKFGELILSNEEWQFMAECEALLRHVDVLAMRSQKDDVNTNVFSYYNVAMTRAAIKRIKELMVMNLDKTWKPKWTEKNIPKIKITKEELMDDTKVLINRLVKELNFYFPNPDSDQILMMVFHPIMVWGGFR